MNEFEPPAPMQVRLCSQSEPDQHYFARYLPELLQLEQLISTHRDKLQLESLAAPGFEGRQFPIHAVSLGSRQADAPVLAFIGGVHGVERIGTQLLLAFLNSVLLRMEWDEGLQQELQQVRLLFCPLLNPVGMAQGTRSNGNGVDLMRNSPLNAEHAPTWMVGGHRLSCRLPWYRGREGGAMQLESQSLCDWIERQLFASPFSLVLDCHSGFGSKDRLWFPWAGSRDPFPHCAEVAALTALFEASYPHHNYLIEPQHHNYLTHGDLWDYLYQQSSNGQGRVFLPLTLELGSWLWVKKNPLQLRSFIGLFNPMVPHRRKRALRGHLLLLEFLIRVTRSSQCWLPTGQMRAGFEQQARKRWYGG